MIKDLQPNFTFKKLCNSLNETGWHFPHSVTDRQIKSFSINYLNFYFNTGREQLGNSWLPYPPLPPFKVTLPIRPPGETAHVIKSLPCQLIHGFINIQMCYQTGTGSSGGVGGALSLLAVVYFSVNYPAVSKLCFSKQCCTSSSHSKSSKCSQIINKHMASKEQHAADFTCRDKYWSKWFIRWTWKVGDRGGMKFASKCKNTLFPHCFWPCSLMCCIHG